MVGPGARVESNIRKTQEFLASFGQLDRIFMQFKVEFRNCCLRHVWLHVSVSFPIF
jgi:hypothetical protein